VQTVAVCVCVCVCDFFYTWCLKCSIWFWPLNIRFSVTWLYYFISQVFSLLNLFFFPFPLFFQCFGPRVRRSAGLPVRSAGPPVRSGPVRGSAGPPVRSGPPVRFMSPPSPTVFRGRGSVTTDPRLRIVTKSFGMISATLSVWLFYTQHGKERTYLMNEMKTTWGRAWLSQDKSYNASETFWIGVNILR
jgi:hypothetical protein